ncbi:helix-turn-helix domain-containing protein [Myroides odoratimimus]|uniref:helix-turn-helix domain-containing protein n=1 Tax=Myroides odoratimimus TaxID=76832 RepID=UPI0025763736|nr:AraC family transcriptional regulator [Myroides odoratimimus]MDM1395842.1 helix-turn-helix transcriptional regulator [Myroides odoratimimus]MDM1528189.1 helix-turn-helix transcriptional regulator [Myroides odoratimimus]
MKIIDSLEFIDSIEEGVFINHEKSTKRYPLHQHQKGQLTYVEGGITYVTVDNVTYVVPAKYFFWIPEGVPHILRLSNSATVLHSLYFYTHDDDNDPFYTTLGIYAASDLLIEMIAYTVCWHDKMVNQDTPNFVFLQALKNILPTFINKNIQLQLPFSDNPRITKITDYLDSSFGLPLTLTDISNKFNMSERSVSRLFQAELQISFLQYLKALRIVKAIELLMKTEHSVSEIANTVGYVTLGAFSNAFCEFTGTRPLEMRKNK